MTDEGDVAIVYPTVGDFDEVVKIRLFSGIEKKIYLSMEDRDGMNFWVIFLLVFGLLSCSENGQSSDNVLTVPESSFNDSLCQSSSSANSENKGTDDDATKQIFCGFAQKGLFEQGSKIYLLSIDAKGDLDTLEVDSTYDRYGRFSISLTVSHSANAVIAVIGKDYSMIWNNVLGEIDTLYGAPEDVNLFL